MTDTKTTLPTEAGHADIIRFNALRHGVLSRYTVLPWEDATEYSAVLAAFAAEHTPLIRAALVLSADHEFNASAFAARVVASTGANLYASTMAGLVAINGPRHGGLTRDVARLFIDLKETTDVDGELTRRVNDRISIPGFGHQLYPDGDVRAVALFAMMRDLVPASPELAFAERVANAVEHRIDRKPNVDFATVALERVLSLPKDSALALFLLGRTVGWIGHAIEQAAHGALIRPRARYIGPRPGA